MFCMQFEFSDYSISNTTTTLAIPTFNSIFPVTSFNSWIVVQQRIDGTTSFARYWVDYRNGFGEYNGNFWFGLEKMHQLTTNGPYSLRFEFQLPDDTWQSAEYDTVVIDDETSAYTIHVTGFSGDTNIDVMNAPEATRVHNGMKFTTRDRDNDLIGFNCASANFINCGWWYNACAIISLNTDYSSAGTFYMAGAFLQAIRSSIYLDAE